MSDASFVTTSCQPGSSSSVAAAAADVEIEFVDTAHHNTNDAICAADRRVCGAHLHRAARDFPTGCDQQSVV